MVQRLIITFSAVFVAVFLGVWLSGLQPAPSAADEPLPMVDKDSSQTPAPGAGEERGYYIKDYNGRVAVIQEGEEVPEMIFNIYTRTLPELDQEQLKTGVFVESYEELTRRVEDYTS